MFLAPVLSLSLLLALLSDGGCTPSGPTSKVGTKPFQFNPDQVSELKIAKSDPASGDHWITTLKKKTKENWEISSPPPDQSIGDRRADDIFIAHLLDTFQTLEISAAAPRGTLESFHLDPPRFAVQWRVPGQQGREFEFKLGSVLKDGASCYFTLDSTQVYIARGAAFKLLNLLDTFHALRKKTWASLVADDVYEIELRHKGKPFLYAQRDGDRWTDRKHKPVPGDVDSFLRRITESQIDRFVDDPSIVGQVHPPLELHPLYEARLSERSGQVTSMKMGTAKTLRAGGASAGTLYGLDSSRPAAVFELPQKTRGLFEKLSGSGS